MPNIAMADYVDCPVLHSADEQELISVANIRWWIIIILFIFARQIAHAIRVSIYHNFSKLFYTSSQYNTENSSYLSCTFYRVF